MMKTILFIFAIILCVANVAFGQTSVTTEEAYNKWRDESLKSYPEGINTPHHCLITKTQRIDDTTARIEFLAVGQIEQVIFEIQPIKINKLTSGEYRETNVGQLSEGRLTGINHVNTSKSMLEMIVPVTLDTNGFRIVWKFSDGDGQEKRNTITTWYKGQPDISVMAMIRQNR